VKYITLYLFIIFIHIISICSAQTDKTFWFAAPEVTAEHADRPIFLRFSTLDEPAKVTISQPANQSFTSIIVDIPAFSTRSVNLDSRIGMIENYPADQILDKGLQITSTSEITAYYEVLGARTSNVFVNTDIYSLKGNYALGTYFLTPFQTHWRNESRNNRNAWSSFIIVATENNTTIKIKPTRDLAGHKAGEWYTIILNKGQSYCGQAAGKLAADHPAGSEIIADKPVAVTVSDDSVLEESSYDLLGDQIIPVEHLGLDYIFIKAGYSDNERGFICATQDSTKIYLNGSDIASAILNKSQTYNFPVGPPSVYVRSNLPVYAFQVASFENELGGAILPETRCSGSRIVRFTRSTRELFVLVITARTGSEGNFLVDGRAGLINAEDFTEVPGTNGQFKTCSKIFSDAQIKSGFAHRIENTSAMFQLGIMNGERNNYGFGFGYFSSFGGLDLDDTVNICPGTNVLLKAGKDYDNYLWNTGEKTNSISVTGLGKYWVKVTKGECEYLDTTFVKAAPLPSVDLPGEINFCRDQPETITAEGSFSRYFWNTGETSPAVSPGTSGTYKVTVFNEFECAASDSVIVNIFPLPEPVIFTDNIDGKLCKDSLIKIQTDTSYSKYLWNTGDTLSYIYKEPGKSYSVDVYDNHNCKGSAEITIDCSPFVSTFNLITPNGDGRNEKFLIEGRHDGKYGLSVFNRWGGRIYYNPSYDNSFSGEGLSDGTYYYSLEHKEGKNKLSGWFQIIRSEDGTTPD
jgi:gliding motility-associated-like protein